LSPTQQQDFKDNEIRNYVQTAIKPSLFTAEEDISINKIRNDRGNWIKYLILALFKVCIYYMCFANTTYLW